MQLLLLRHGDAWPAVLDDASRELSPLGEEQAIRAGNMLRNLKISPGLALVSPLRRARQTLDHVLTQSGSIPVRISEYLTPTTDPRQIIRELNGIQHPTVLVVGHEPHLSTLSSMLVSGNRQSGPQVRTGTLIALDVSGQCELGTGKLLWVLHQDEMRERLSA